MDEQDFFIPNSPDRNPDLFHDSTLILPIVSLGNVPQLAVDLFIHNPQLGGSLEKVGILDPQDHIPVVGAIDQPSCRRHSNDTRNQITTPIEVYQTPDRRYTFIQPRSPVLKVRKHVHITRLKNWISNAGFSSVLILVSVDAATRSDPHLQNPSPFFYYIPPGSKQPTELRHRMRTRYASYIPESSTSLPLFSAGGLAARLVAAFAPFNPEPEINTLVIYVAEGDNRLDAKALTSEIVHLLGLDRSELVEPLSWNASDSFHSRTRQAIFG